MKIVDNHSFFFFFFYYYVFENLPFKHLVDLFVAQHGPTRAWHPRDNFTLFPILFNWSSSTER